MRSRRWPLALGIVLVLVTAWVYAPVRTHTFVDHDDHSFVVGNEHLVEPFDTGWLVHNFTEVHHADWIPLTWLSYRIDVAISGISAPSMLTTNVVLHAIASVLVAFVLGMATRSWTIGLVVAFFFAVHPQRVESVAWVSARRDVLGAVFALASVLAYVRGTRAGAFTPVHDVIAAALFGLALLANPLVVGLPLGLLLLDHWPLRRERSFASLVVEKLPWFGLAGACLLVVTRTRQGLASLSGPSEEPFAVVAGRLEALARTLLDAVWPAHLSAFYPRPLDGPTPFVIAVALLTIAAITAIALWQFRPRPYLAIGWAWALVTLLPAVMGLDAGDHARADRWMVLPSIGIGLMVAGLVDEIVRARPRWRVPASALCIGVAVVLAVQAHARVGHWRDTESLFTDALRVDPGNWYAHHRIARVRMAQDDLDRAQEHHLSALVRVPAHARAQAELADLYDALGQRERADALRANAELTGAHDRFADGNLGMVLVRIGEDARAIDLLERALVRDPRSGDLHAALALARARTLDTTGARAHVDHALRVAPRTPNGLILLAWLLATAPEAELRDPEMARRALAQLDPRDGPPRADHLDALAATQAAMGHHREAFATARRAADAALAHEHYDLADRIEDRILLYLQGEPFYETRQSRPVG